LSEVSLTVYPGEIHGIVGQNGSGKSTFVKAISGYHAPDPGAVIRVDGHTLRLPIHPTELRRSGVSIVHQDLGLIQDASVVENVRIAAMRGSRWSRRVNWKNEGKTAKAALERLGYDGSLTVTVGELAPADRARVAIARAIQGHEPGRGLIIFDESTRALPGDALDDFYGTLRDLLVVGTGVLMIGHRLGEILTHCDRVTVLRDGRQTTNGVPTDGLSESELAVNMLGHELRHMSFDRARSRQAEGGVSVRKLTGVGLSGALDLGIAQGEIVGLTGLPGAGFESVPYLLTGARPATGKLELGDETVELESASVATLVRRGVVLVPEDRLTEGLSLEHSIADNISLPWLSDRGRAWLAGRHWQRAEAMRVISTLGVVPPDPDQLVGRLSGGNAQKVLLGKWLVSSPRLLVLHEPTQGVDVKARLDLLDAVHRTAEAGAAVLIASTEPEDLVTVCDRIVFFIAGAATSEIEYPFDAQRVLRTIYSDTPGSSLRKAAGALRD